MGTRHLIEVQIGGETKIAQYGQWDGYLEGQGKGIATFLHVGMEKPVFHDALRNCRFMTEAELEQLDEIDWKKTHPQLSRDVGSDVLDLVQRACGLPLRDQRDFKNDKVSCEYAYLIDMDAETVRVTCRRGQVTVPFAEFTPEFCEQKEDVIFGVPAEVD